MMDDLPPVVRVLFALTLAVILWSVIYYVGLKLLS